MWGTRAHPPPACQPGLRTPAPPPLAGGCWNRPRAENAACTDGLPAGLGGTAPVHRDEGQAAGGCVPGSSSQFSQYQGRTQAPGGLQPRAPRRLAAVPSTRGTGHRGPCLPPSLCPAGLGAREGFSKGVRARTWWVRFPPSRPLPTHLAFPPGPGAPGVPAGRGGELWGPGARKPHAGAWVPSPAPLCPWELRVCARPARLGSRPSEMPSVPPVSPHSAGLASPSSFSPCCPSPSDTGQCGQRGPLCPRHTQARTARRKPYRVPSRLGAPRGFENRGPAAISRSRFYGPPPTTVPPDSALGLSFIVSFPSSWRPLSTVSSFFSFLKKNVELTR